MYIVKDKKTGLYYKKGNIRSWWDAKLVERRDATIYRNKAAVKISLGKMITNDPKDIEVMDSGWKFQHCHYELEINKWEIEEINF